MLLGTGAGTFGAATNFTAGPHPRSVAIADVNGDGKPDLLVASTPTDFLYGTGTVSVLLGTGTGSFATATNFAAGNDANSMAVADVNGDGKPDLVVTNYHTATVSVLLGTGTGTFGALTSFAVGLYPASVAVADVNGDGKPDLVVANYGSHTVSVLLGNGNGSFGAADQLHRRPGALRGGRGRQRRRQARPGRHQQIRQLRQRAAGQRQRHVRTATNLAVGTHPTAVAVADVNGDGKPDLVVVNEGDNISGFVANVSVLLNSYAAVSSLPFSAPSTFAVGNDDNVLAARRGGRGRQRRRQARPGRRQSAATPSACCWATATGRSAPRRPSPPDQHPNSVAVADVNGDGKPDLVVAENVF